MLGEVVAWDNFCDGGRAELDAPIPALLPTSPDLLLKGLFRG